MSNLINKITEKLVNLWKTIKSWLFTWLPDNKLSPILDHISQENMVYRLDIWKKNNKTPCPNFRVNCKINDFNDAKNSWLSNYPDARIEFRIISLPDDKP